MRQSFPRALRHPEDGHSVGVPDLLRDGQSEFLGPVPDESEKSFCGFIRACTLITQGHARGQGSGGSPVGHGKVGALENVASGVVDTGKPRGSLETERNGQGVLGEGTADHDGLRVCFDQAGERVTGALQIRHQTVLRGLEHQASAVSMTSWLVRDLCTAATGEPCSSLTAAR